MKNAKLIVNNLNSISQRSLHALKCKTQTPITLPTLYTIRDCRT